ncbi:MAG: hypothetical protein ACJAUG_000083 [Halioglobus sp.]|jgi:hypothetical protein
MPAAEVPATGSNISPGRLIWLLPLLAVAGFYFFYVYQHALNVPLADDIYDVLQPLVRVSDSEHAAAAFAALYEQHTDHRTIASRFIYGAVYLATGEVNFRTLNFLANLALPLLLFALYLMSSGTPKRLLILLPAALVLLQLRAYGITFWAMASFAYFYVFAYGFFCLLLLQDTNKGRFSAAVLLAILSSLTLASGQMVWLVGLASLAQQSLIRRSLPSAYLLWWLLLTIAVLILWRAGLDDRIPLTTLLGNFFNAPGHYLLYTLTLLGCAVSESSVAAAASVGGAMLVILSACTVIRWREADLRLEMCCWFIVLSVMTMVLGRGFASVDYGLSSRYSFPSVLLLSSIWVLLSLRLRIHRWPALLPAIVLALVYNVHSFTVYSLALQPYMERRVEDFNKGRYRAWSYPVAQSNRIVTDAIELGIYTPPLRPLAAASVAFGQRDENN